MVSKTHRLWFWAVAMAVLAALATWLRSRVGLGYHLGDLAAIALMVGSTCVVLISQQQAVAATVEREER